MNPADPPRPEAAANADDDVRLARRALARDTQALEELASRLACVPRMLHVINERLGAPLNEHDLADVTQDTILLLWTRLETYTNVARLETWAYGHARWSYMNAVRKRARRDARAQAAAPEPSALGEAPLDGSELLALLEELAPDEARVVRHKVLEDRSFEEIATLERVSPNTLKARYYRAIAKLALKLRAERWGFLQR